MEKIIYVVQGSTGEYSDNREWMVCAFEDEEKAKEMVNDCTLEYLRIQQDLTTLDSWYYLYESLVEKNKIKPHRLDEKFEIDNTGTNYTYYPTKLILNGLQ